MKVEFLLTPNDTNVYHGIVISTICDNLNNIQFVILMEDKTFCNVPIQYCKAVNNYII